MISCDLIIISCLLSLGIVVDSFCLLNHCKFNNKNGVFMTYKPSVYVPIKVLNPNIQREVTVLVNQNKKDIISSIHRDGWDDVKLSEWERNGFAFRSDESGTAALLQSENERRESNSRYVKKIPQFFNKNIYKNAGTESDLILLKSSKATPEILSGIKLGTIETDSLENQGFLFTNLTKLFSDEKLTSRADDIAIRLKEEHSISSAPWSKWTTASTKHNATSLTQVMGEYFREHSIGDVGGKDANYSPKPGYPGTLAPGENFKESNPFDTLPNRILHPWPAMQEIPFHVRWPPSHPMIPPPLLWFALNNMYTQNFTDTQLELPASEIVGGSYMQPKDALRIARDGRFGMAYDPTQQLRHGGMIFPGGHNIKHYNPDHGPTYSAEEAKPPIPPELYKYTERWMDTFYDEDIYSPTEILSADDTDEFQREEALRKDAAEKILSEMPIKPKWQIEKEKESLKSSDWITERVDALQRNRLEPAVPTIFDGFFDTETDENILREQRQADELQARKESTNAKRISDALLGTARGKRELITYSIDLLREMQVDMIETEKDLATKRKSGRRRQRKKSSTADKALQLAAEDTLLTSADADAVVAPHDITADTSTAATGESEQASPEE